MEKERERVRIEKVLGRGGGEKKVTFANPGETCKGRGRRGRGVWGSSQGRNEKSNGFRARRGKKKNVKKVIRGDEAKREVKKTKEQGDIDRARYSGGLGKSRRGRGRS
jgi:hypothetical protein